MAGLRATLEIAKGTLLNTQLQIQTASNNIANAENKTYARQKAVVKANPAINIYPNWLGTGADVTMVTQIRDQFIEQRLLNAVSDESKYSELSSQLQTIQAVFSDSGDTGISKSLNAFWASWDGLAQNPTGAAQQTEVYQAAQNLAETIQSAYTQLDASATTDIPGKITDTVDQANSLIDQIAQLNAAILKNETASHPANDLRDLRYQALKDLSAIIPVSTSEDANGVVTVSTTDASGSLTLVTGGTVNNYISSTSTITGGSFGGLQTALEDVNGYLDRLNDFAAQLIDQVNTIHGTNSGPAVFTGSDAATITASTTFLSGQTAADEAPRALALAELQGSTITFTDAKTATFNQYLGDIQKEIGLDAQQAETNLTFNEALRTQLDSQQQSISGVSIDEEMVDLIQFQHIYEAAAKVIQKTAEMLKTVIDMVQ